MKKQKRYFQWIAGEQKGDVVMLETIEEFEGETFYNFDDGESCNLRYISKMTDSVGDLKQKFMVEIESPANPWTFETIQPRKYIDESMKGEDIEIPSLHDILQAHGNETNIDNSDIGSEKLIPPKKRQRLIELPNVDDYKEEHEVSTPAKVETKVVDNTVQTTIEEKKEEFIQPQQNTKQFTMDPVKILVDSCKKHDTQVDLTLNMKLPSKYIYNIAASEFEDGVEKFINCIVNDIDLTMVVNELKEALRTAYVSEEKSEA